MSASSCAVSYCIPGVDTVLLVRRLTQQQKDSLLLKRRALSALRYLDPASEPGSLGRPNGRGALKLIKRYAQSYGQQSTVAAVMPY